MLQKKLLCTKKIISENYLKNKNPKKVVHCLGLEVLELQEF